MCRAFMLGVMGLLVLPSSRGWGQPPDREILAQGKDFEVFRAPGWRDGEGRRALSMVTLLHKGIQFGGQFQPSGKADDGNEEEKYRRLATTYYFPRGPVGMVLERFNWFPGEVNTYAADARLPASLAATTLGEIGCVPMGALTVSWSEPPIAVVGMWTGTLASYARPYQRMDFFERLPVFVELSLPTKGRPLFTYMSDAQNRGAIIRVIPGEYRPTFEKIAPEGFYRVIVVECNKEGGSQPLNERMLTREAMEMLEKSLAPEGVVCFHTSHRYIKIPGGLIGTANKLGWFGVVGQDQGDQSDYERSKHFSSEWVMIAKEKRTLDALKTPPPPKRKRFDFAPKRYWDEAEHPLKVWNDADFPFAGLYRGAPQLFWLQSLSWRAEHDARPWIGLNGSRMLGNALRALHDSLERAALKTLNSEKSRAARE